MACLCCGVSSEVGSLCRGCAQQVPPCEGLIAEHISSSVKSGDAEAWLVDGFGRAHAVAGKSMVGRANDPSLQLTVLAASVSREHAELKCTEGAWTVRDLGSRNGTFVDSVRCQGRVTLPKRAILKIGDVPMWFLAEVVEDPAPPPTLETASVGTGLVRYVLTVADREACVVGNSDVTSGGTLMVRTRGVEAWTNHELAPLEFQLLRSLCVRAHAEASSPAAAKGCVSTKQLVTDLPWKTRFANDENVRQVVRRLRGALGEAALGQDLLCVQPGRGYYLSCPVTV
jgi:hypothetical protein